MASFSDIRYHVDDDIATVTLDRPDALNALRPTLLDELEVAMEQAEDDAVRVVVLTGNGSAFSAGYDIGEDEDDLGSVEDRMRDRR